MSRRVLPPQLQSVGESLLVRAHESGQLLWEEVRVSFLDLASVFPGATCVPL